VISVLCAACSGDSCDEVALQLRECCKQGPAELRAGCEKEAEQLEEGGDTDACDADLEQGAFERCGQ
jgi:hypothetical protein